MSVLVNAMPMWIVRIAAIVLLLWPRLGVAQNAGVERSDSIRIHSAAVQATQRFTDGWRFTWLRGATWMKGEYPSGPPFAWSKDERGLRRGGPWTRCAPDSVSTDWIPTWSEHVIVSHVSQYCVRPNWPLFISGWFPNIGTVIDSAFGPTAQSRISAARDSLIHILDESAARLPGDLWIAGQRVRFLLDQRYRDVSYGERALSAARECQPNTWWCAALTGYALASLSRIEEADSAFVTAIALMPAGERCTWTSAAPLIDASDAATYAQLSCAERETINARLWWLSDPLWVTEFNERRVEHYARLMAILVRGMLPRSERFNWLPKDGGDAVRAMVIRYGWPSFMFHLRVPARTPKEVVDHPLTTLEYSLGRVHTVPRWEAIVNPFAAADSDWSLNPPDTSRLPPLPPLVYDENGEIEQPQEYRRAYSRMLNWWPVEHYQPSRPLVQFEHPQVVFLRRDGADLLYMAADLPRAAPYVFQGRLAASILRSASPDSVLRVAYDHTDATGRLVVIHAPIPATPAVFGLEVESTAPDGPDGRMRFGATPPPALDDASGPEWDVSTPMLFDPGDASGDSVVDPAVALTRMLGSTSVDGSKAIGIYWETYGFAATDTVQITLHVERAEQPGVFKRIAFALGLAGNRSESTEVGWEEPGAGPDASVLRASRPIIRRTTVLSLADAEPGGYQVEVRVTGQDHVASGRRLFQVRGGRDRRY